MFSGFRLTRKIPCESMPPTDPQLLSSYPKSRKESAFAELVERYLPLVRGILWRRTRNIELVDELSMQVFAALAQNASRLQKRPTIGGWLVITARQKAAEAIRNETTRRKHMKKFAAEPDTDSIPSHFDGGTCHLDDALAELSEVDRQAVLLHFYEKLPYREVGRRIGKKEDATRKRVNKALERMNTFLGRRGVTLGTTALAGGLASHLASASVQASATAATISSGALSLANSTPSTIAVSPLTKWSLACVAVLCASTGAGYIAARTSHSHTPPKGKLASPSILSKKRTPLPTLQDAVAADLLKPVEHRLRRATDLWELSRRRVRSTAWLEYQAIMDSFTVDECEEALAILDRDYAYNHERHWRMAHDLLNTMKKADPSWVAKLALQQIHLGKEIWYKGNRIHEAISSWACIAPNEVEDWLQAADIPPDLREELTPAFIRGTSHSDPKAALEMAFDLPWEQRKEVLGSLFCMREPGLREITLAETAALFDEFERAEVFQEVVLPALTEPNEVSEVFATMDFPRSDAVVPLIDQIIQKSLLEDAQDRTSLFDFAIGNLPKAAHSHLLDAYVSRWLVADRQLAIDWLGRHGLTPDDVANASASFQFE